MTEEADAGSRPADDDPDSRTDDPGEDAPGDHETPPDDHLDGVPAGAGCTGIWEHLSEQRREDDE